MNRRDAIENALDALGSPDPRPTAVLMDEIWDEINAAFTSPTGARLVESRGERYGHPKEQWSRAAALFTAILNGKLREPIDAHEVGLLMIGWKLSRLCSTPDDPDSLHDLAGYAAALEVFHGREPTV